eukprot:PhF_6_TR21935/c0_g1_i1/m.31168
MKSLGGIGEKLLRKQGWDENMKIIGTSGNGLEKPIEAFEVTDQQGIGFDKSSTMKYTSAGHWTSTHLDPFHDVLARANGKPKKKKSGSSARSSPAQSPHLGPRAAPNNSKQPHKPHTKKDQEKATTDDDDDDVPVLFAPKPRKQDDDDDEIQKVKKSPVMGPRRVVYSKRIKMRTDAMKCDKSMAEILGAVHQGKRHRE